MQTRLEARPRKLSWIRNGLVDAGHPERRGASAAGIRRQRHVVADVEAALAHELTGEEDGFQPVRTLAAGCYHEDDRGNRATDGNWNQDANGGTH
jgi:hypothetical protein